MQQDIWYYAQNNERQGPVTLEELRALCSTGRLAPGDLVWTVGMEQWQAAGEVAALVDAFRGTVAAPAPWPNPHMDEPQPMPPPPAGYPSQFPQPLDYAQPEVPAGFWMRFAAYLIDAVVLAIPGCVFGRGVPSLMGVGLPAQPTREQMMSFLFLSCGTNIIALVIGWLYYALMESSANQGTLGKMALGIKVTDMAGQRITFGRASGRFFAKLLSSLILCIGYMMAGWTQKKQALHDILADTLVVRK